MKIKPLKLKEVLKHLEVDLKSNNSSQSLRECLDRLAEKNVMLTFYSNLVDFNKDQLNKEQKNYYPKVQVLRDYFETKPLLFALEKAVEVANVYVDFYNQKLVGLKGAEVFLLLGNDDTYAEAKDEAWGYINDLHNNLYNVDRAALNVISGLQIDDLSCALESLETKVQEGKVEDLDDVINFLLDWAMFDSLNELARLLLKELRYEDFKVVPFHG